MNRFYALVNLNSESVRAHLEAIATALRDFPYPVDADYERWLEERPEGWSHVDAQLEKANGYESLLVFGGDGTHTYVLDRLRAMAHKPQFIGIQCGTMNMGSVANPLSALERFGTMRTEQRDAICCQTASGESHALVDSVVTTTCVGRLNGRISQFSAEKILQGVKCHADPAAVGDANTRITVYRNGESLEMPRMEHIFTVSAAFLPAALGARVLAGGADPEACRGFTWGLILSDFPLVWADVTAETLQHAPVTSVFYPLQLQDTVEVRGLNQNAHLVNDGNAVCSTHAVRWHYQKDYYQIVKLEEAHHANRTE